MPLLAAALSFLITSMHFGHSARVLSFTRTVRKSRERAGHPSQLNRWATLRRLLLIVRCRAGHASDVEAHGLSHSFTFSKMARSRICICSSSGRLSVIAVFRGTVNHGLQRLPKIKKLTEKIHCHGSQQSTASPDSYASTSGTASSGPALGSRIAYFDDGRRRPSLDAAIPPAASPSVTMEYSMFPRPRTVSTLPRAGFCW